jgi:DNA-binding MarR family transcriptional regulator
MNDLIDIIAKLSGMMGQMEESAKEQFNLSSLTLTQMHYLEIINHLDNPSITELATVLKLSKPTVTVAIDKLVEKEYVFKVKSDKDRRSAHIHLTEKGLLINQMHDYAHKRISESISNKLNKDEMEQLIELLNKILNNK